MNDTLRNVINALNQVEVRGSKNLNLLLASIQELERLERRMEDADEPVARKHV